jgi:protein SDA1
MSELEIFRLKPGKESERFAELVTFISHVAPCYKTECSELPEQLMSLLEEHGAILTPAIRVKLVQALVLLRNRGLLNPTDLLQLFFKLFRVQDKVSYNSSLCLYCSSHSHCSLTIGMVIQLM